MIIEGICGDVFAFEVAADAVPHATKIKASWSLLPLDDGWYRIVALR
jgi:hypothetical protein